MAVSATKARVCKNHLSLRHKEKHLLLQVFFFIVKEVRESNFKSLTIDRNRFFGFFGSDKQRSYCVGL